MKFNTHHANETANGLSRLNSQPARRPAGLADEINAEHRAFIAARETALQHAINCGLLLIRAKSQCRHGEWERWLQDNVIVSERSAQQYMRVAQHRNELHNPESTEDLMSIAGALKTLAAPPKRITETTQVPKSAASALLTNGNKAAVSADLKDGRRAVEFDPAKMEREAAKQNGKERTTAALRKEALSTFGKLLRLMDKLKVTPNVEQQLKDILAAIKES